MTNPRPLTGLRRAIATALRTTPAGRALLLGLIETLETHRRRPLSNLKARREVRARAQARLSQFLSAHERLDLRTSAEPEVSVILVLFNQAALTLACLESLARRDGPRIEVLIVDNRSTDETSALLQRVDGARVLPQAENLGFLRAVNLAAAQARAPALLLLNNDAEIEPDAILRGLEALSPERIGAVGGRIVLPEGRLQEAGSIVWRDGACQGYARGRPPDAPEAMVRRTVDYCSGAFLLIKRNLWERLGGFDERFAPAYYEETDFCLRLWAEGFAVLFEPEVLVRHLEFGSMTAPKAALDLQRRNQAVFAQKHAAALAERDPPGQAHRGRTWPRPRRRVLVIDDHVPAADLGAGFPRAQRLIQALGRVVDEVTLFPTFGQQPDWPHIRRTIPPQIEVVRDMGADRLPWFLRDRRGLYDAIVVSRPNNMGRLKEIIDRTPALRPPRVIYDAEAVFALRRIEKRRALGRPLSERDAARLIDREMTLARFADTAIAVSEAEAARMREAGCPDVRILGHALQPAPAGSGPGGRSGLLFVGNLDHDHSPNVESLVWFAEKVWPLLRRETNGEIHLTVVGRNRSRRLRRIMGPGMALLGPVAHLTPLYAAARVFVAPTRYAAGVPHKVHEAAARGLPVVATPLLAQQLGWVDGEALLVGAEPEAFADAVLRLMRDDALWSRLRENALSCVARDCDPARFDAAAMSLLDPAQPRSD